MSYRKSIGKIEQSWQVRNNRDGTKVYPGPKKNATRAQMQKLLDKYTNKKPNTNAELSGASKGGTHSTKSLIKSADKAGYVIVGEDNLIIPGNYKGTGDTWLDLSRDERFRMKWDFEGQPSGAIGKRNLTEDEVLQLSRISTDFFSDSILGKAQGAMATFGEYPHAATALKRKSGISTVAHEAGHGLDSLQNQVVKNKTHGIRNDTTRGITDEVPMEEMEALIGRISDKNIGDSIGSSAELGRFILESPKIAYTRRESLMSESIAEGFNMMVSDNAKFVKLFPGMNKYLLKHFDNPHNTKLLLHGLTEQGFTVKSAAAIAMYIGIPVATVKAAMPEEK